MATRLTHAQAAAQAPLDAIHFAAIGFVIVASEMQHAVKNQYAQFGRQSAIEPSRIAARGGRRNRDVTSVAPRDARARRTA